VWNELKVWQDANGNGTAEAGETQTLAQLGITSLNYAMGTFERNGQLSQLSSPDLIADNYFGAANDSNCFCERRAA